MRILRIVLLLVAISVTCSSCFVYFGDGGHGHGWHHRG
jgi:hypothetical protein